MILVRNLRLKILCKLSICNNYKYLHVKDTPNIISCMHVISGYRVTAGRCNLYWNSQTFVLHLVQIFYSIHNVWYTHASYACVKPHSYHRRKIWSLLITYRSDRLEIRFALCAYAALQCRLFNHEYNSAPIAEKYYYLTFTLISQPAWNSVENRVV